jgi:aminopeptidase-like protein
MKIPCKVHSYPADGEHKTFSWTAPLTWNVRSGSLRQVAPKEQTLIRFDEIPHGIIAHSQGGGATGEVVDVGEGTSPQDYDKIDVVDKFVMATGQPREVAPLAVERGAIGVILYPTPQQADRWPDMVRYGGFWPNAAQADQTPLGFSISRRQADDLLIAMRTGPVRLVGTIDANLYSGSLQVLEGWIPGRNLQLREILLIAHLCHPRPSANDNASGSGLLLEIARTFAELAAAGKIELARTVRFLWVPEFYGTLPWVTAHCEQVKRLLFVLNLDMVGESPEQLGEPFCVSQAPGSALLNSWFAPLLARIADDRRTTTPCGSRRSLHWRIVPPSGGSDHIVFSDPTFGIPAVMFGHNDPLHHTHLDDMEMVDSTQLNRVGLLSAALVLLPELLPQERDRLAGWLLRYSIAELTDACDLTAGNDIEAGTKMLDLALHREEERAEHFRDLLAEANVFWNSRAHLQSLHAVHAAIRRPFETEKEPSTTASEMRLRKAFVGPLPYDFIRELPEADRRFLEQEFSGPYGAMTIEGLNLCDGDHTPQEIAVKLSLEFKQWIPVNTVSRALAIMQQNGWVSS